MNTKLKIKLKTRNNSNIMISSTRLLLISSTLLILIMSCKKDTTNSSSSDNKCKMNTFNSGALSSAVTINYDSQGRIIKTSGDLDPRTDNVYFSYTYSGNTITENMDNPNPGQKYQIVNTLNSDELTIKRVYTGTNESEVVNFEYNGTQLSKAVQTTVKYGDTDTYNYTYTWLGGNLVSVNETSRYGTWVLNYSYYTDLPNRQGDYFFNNLYKNYSYNLKEQSFLDIRSVRNKNLLKGIIGDNNNLQLVYTFDNKNNISSISGTGVSPYVTNSLVFTYNCN